MGTSDDRLAEARQRLKAANEQMGQAAVHSWEPAEPAECVTKCFYAFENALTAAALAVGQKTSTKHYEKAKLATQLTKKGILKTDVSDRLIELNDLRKDVQYGEPGQALANADLEDILAELQAFLDEVEQIVADAENEGEEGQ
jgi:uncharacterized protein (UPF0332 family)